MNAQLYKIDPSSGCWLWLGSVSGRGYGRIQAGGKSRAAHRVSYEEATGTTIPEGMLCDHKCRTRLCINPDHLRIVDSRTNIVENSTSVSAINAVKTHCINGHEFTPENTNLRTRKNGPMRICRICQAESSRKYKRRKRQALAQAKHP